jgi:hypothetical protein
MPDGEARAVRGGEPAGAQTPRGDGCPPAPASTPAGADETHARRGRATVPSGMLTDTRAGRGASGPLGPVHTASLRVAVPRGDHPTCEDHTAGWPKEERS